MIWGKSSSGSGNSKCKCPEVEMTLLCLKSKKESYRCGWSVVERREAGNKVRESRPDFKELCTFCLPRALVPLLWVCASKRRCILFHSIIFQQRLTFRICAMTNVKISSIGSIVIEWFSVWFLPFKAGILRCVQVPEWLDIVVLFLELHKTWV